MASALHGQVSPDPIKPKGQRVSQHEMIESEFLSQESISLDTAMDAEEPVLQQREKFSQSATVAASKSRRLDVPLLHLPLCPFLALHLSRFLWIPLCIPARSASVFPFMPSPFCFPKSRGETSARDSRRLILLLRTVELNT